MTFADGRSSTRVFCAFQRLGVDESLRRARIQESNTADLYGDGAARMLILAVKEESSIDTTPATRQGPCSASKGGR